MRFTPPPWNACGQKLRVSRGASGSRPARPFDVSHKVREKFDDPEINK